MDTKNPLDTNVDLIGKNLNRNLSKLMEDNRISLSVLYRNTGIAIPTIKRLQSDPTTNPTISTLLPIANFFGITISQLIGSELFLTEVTGFIENKTHWLSIPLIQWNQAVNWKESGDKDSAESHILVDIDVGQHAYALTVDQDDWPFISKGSILIINSDIKPEHKDFAVVYKSGQINPTLKQVMIDEEKMYLKSMSPYFPPTILDESYHFLGVLIQIRKDTKV
jgi:SOS-response transcriptional repressor LexA